MSALAELRRLREWLLEVARVGTTHSHHGYRKALNVVADHLIDRIAELAARQEPSDAEIEAWANAWAKCWNSVALRLPQDVLQDHEKLGVQAVALLRRARPDDGDLVREIVSLTAEFRDWQEADAELIEGQEEDVAADHNRMLARLLSIRSMAENALAARKSQPAKADDGELVRLREWLTSAWDGRGMTLREELDNRIAALAARNPEARQ